MSVKYERALEQLTSQGKFHIKLGLERVQAVLDLLDNPQDKLKFIHVAGTNGKGSVCAILSFVLSEAGLKTGLFTSPHIFEYTERIKVNNMEIPSDVFAQKTLEIIDLAEKNDIHLTEFEIITVLAFVYFKQENVDVVILETGLGGRLDATNVIKSNLCSVITNIDLDHTDRLGDTIEKISREKAGIIKEKCPVVVSLKNKGFEIVKEMAKKRNSKLIIISNNIKDIYIEALSLKGSYQKENLALALHVLETIGVKIEEENLKKSLSRVKHPARFEYIKEKNILIDGAHNPQGAKFLRKSLDKYFPQKKKKYIFGCLKNKDYPQMLKNLFGDISKDDQVYFYQFSNPNACSVEELKDKSPFKGKGFSDFRQESDYLTVVCGSFYMIKEVLNIINQN